MYRIKIYIRKKIVCLGPNAALNRMIMAEISVPRAYLQNVFEKE